MRKAVGQVLAQTCADWRFVYVNDGPAPASRRVFESLAGSDERMRYLETSKACNDWGWTPRNEGVRQLARAASPLDYLVMWDDDDRVNPDALELIRAEIVRLGRPDFLIVPVWHGDGLVPRDAGSVSAIGAGDVFSFNLVSRFDLAVKYLLESAGRGGLRGGDFLFFDCVRKCPGLRIELSRMKPIGVYDGLRPWINLRWKLGIPKLGVERIPVLNSVRRLLRG